jgi:hypothetical protein
MSTPRWSGCRRFIVARGDVFRHACELVIYICIEENCDFKPNGICSPSMVLRQLPTLLVLYDFQGAS